MLRLRHPSPHDTVTVLLRRLSRQHHLAEDKNIFLTRVAASDGLPEADLPQRVRAARAAFDLVDQLDQQQQLTDSDKEILMFWLLAHSTLELRDTMHAFGVVQRDTVTRITAAALHLPDYLVELAYAEQGNLQRAGLLIVRGTAGTLFEVIQVNESLVARVRP
ncbi:MAG TPA: hypothetical protein VNE00_23075 [Paraburkholderia sp.]|jgi:hypothetical protein|nr:hypothetical protein [Paraburkholderia sp.]